MQLCALRYLGFVPEDLKFAPLEAIRFVADQLKVSSSALETYGGREQTQSDHFGEVREHLGYSLPRPQDYEGCWSGSSTERSNTIKRFSFCGSPAIAFGRSESFALLAIVWCGWWARPARRLNRRHSVCWSLC